MAWPRLLPILLVTACFSEDNSDGTGLADTGDGSSTAGSTTTATSTSAGTGSASGVDESTAAGELGPQIVSSIPADGDLAAALDNYFFVYFDREISLADAVGKFTVSQGGGMPVTVTPVLCPPDNDPTCVAAQMPESFTVRGGDSGHLPAGTPHEIIVAADFPDLDGNVNTMDQVIAFTTFEFTANWFDDSEAIPMEVGGIAYDPAGEALFLVGPDAALIDTIVRRVPIPGGVAQPATTVVTVSMTPNGAWAYGLSRHMGELWVPMTAAGDVRRYTNLGAPVLTETIFGPTTTLPAPYDVLAEAHSVAATPTSVFVAFGEYLAGEDRVGIVELTTGTDWSLFEDGEPWGNAPCAVTAGVVDGDLRLYAIAGQEIFVFRLADDTLLDSYAVDPMIDPRDATLALDGAGRLWLGTIDGLQVFDATAADLPVVAERRGVEANRFALREDGTDVNVYFVPFRGPAVIGHLVVGF